MWSVHKSVTKLKCMSKVFAAYLQEDPTTKQMLVLFFLLFLVYFLHRQQGAFVVVGAQG